MYPAGWMMLGLESEARKKHKISDVLKSLFLTRWLHSLAYTCYLELQLYENFDFY